MLDMEKIKKDSTKLFRRSFVENPFKLQLTLLMLAFLVFCPFIIEFNRSIEVPLSSIESSLQRACYVFDFNSHEGVFLLIAGLTIILASAFIIFRTITILRNDFESKTPFSAVVLNILSCLLIALATLTLLNNPIIWALSVILATAIASSKLSD